MGLVSRFLGTVFKTSDSRLTVPPSLRLSGLGLFSLEAVGESHYEAALDRIVGGRSEQGADKLVDAILVHENDNPYDSQAVRIDIAGETVGYLSRAHAREYRRQMANAGHAGVTAVCAARIRGGWDRGARDQGSYGVRLDLAVTKS